MNAISESLDSETRARIFDEEIVPDSKLLQKVSHEHPKAIILGGQPGSGKGGLARAARAEFDGDVVTIDPDKLRDYKPRVDEFRASNPYNWSGRTQAEASQWADELREVAVAGKKNLIFDTTLSNGSWTADLIKDLQAEGYEVEVRAVAANKLESEWGVDSRFSKQLISDGYGRYVPAEARDVIYDKVPASLDTIHAQTRNAPIRVFSREGMELYDSRHDARLPGSALDEAREARLGDPKITRGLSEGWKEQRQWHETLPETIAENSKVAPDTAQRLLVERSELNVVEGVQRDAARAVSLDYGVRVHPMAVKGLGIVAGAEFVYDTAKTAGHTSDLLDQGNRTAAQSEIEHFGSRNLGMLGGAALGAEVLGAAGIESGPLDLIVGGAGAIGGAFAGDKLANAYDNHRIYNQTDAKGMTWNYDPAQSQQGWTIDLPPLPETPHGQHLTADPALAEQLTYQANSAAVELALGHPASPQDPYSQPSAGNDTPSKLPAPWIRDADTQHWSRQVTDQVMEHGLTSNHTVVANPQRAAQLDAAAQQTIAANVAHSQHGMAQHYQSLYEQQGWQKHGPMPDAVTDALKTPAHKLEASDGHTYTQSENGQWQTPETLWGTNVAEGHVRAELDATDRAAASSVRQTAPALAANDPRHPANPHHGLYEQLKERIPEASEARLLQFTDACNTKGIGDKNLGEIAFDRQGGHMIFNRSFVGPLAIVDVKEASPQAQQSIQHIQQTDHAQAQIQTHIQAQQTQAHQQQAQGPMPGGPGF